MADILSQQQEDTESFKRIVSLVSCRDRSEKELRDRLLREDFEREEVESAIWRAKRCDLISDVRFAQARISGLLAKGKGKSAIERELLSSGIDLDSIEDWPDAYFSDEGKTEFDRALALLRKKPSSSKNQFQGNFNKLVRYGYCNDVAYRATKAYLEGIQ